MVPLSKTSCAGIYVIQNRTNMKHGTICRLGNILFDYRGKTKQGHVRGGHSVNANTSKCYWVCPSKDGNVMCYICNDFRVATPDEVDIFNKAINKNK